MCTDELQTSDPATTAFPASAATPGQGESRGAFARFREWVATVGKSETPRPELPEKLPGWMQDYTTLRAEGWTWRQAVYIAWAASPSVDRWPENLEALASQVLGCSARVVRKWREKNPAIDERAGRLASDTFMHVRRDVIDAVADVATRHEFKAYNHQRMVLEITGDYNPKKQIAHTGAGGGPVKVDFGMTDLDDEQLEQLIRNLQQG